MANQAPLIGSPELKSAFTDRLDQIYRRSDWVLTGSAGRQITQWALDWPKKTPIVLAEFANGGEGRDLDVFRTRGGFSTKDPTPKNPIQVDHEFNSVFNPNPNRPLVMGSGRAPIASLSDAVLGTRIRSFAGHRVRTLRVGDEFLIASLYPTPQDRYRRKLQVLADFTGWALRNRPQEFAQPQDYEPYAEAARANGNNIDILLRRSK